MFLQNKKNWGILGLIVYHLATLFGSHFSVNFSSPFTKQNTPASNPWPWFQIAFLFFPGSTLEDILAAARDQPDSIGAADDDEDSDSSGDEDKDQVSEATIKKYVKKVAFLFLK
jgi:hypothetical protein